jgi:cytochrome b561
MDRYHRGSVWIHWLMFVLFAIALTCIEVRGWVPRASGMALRNQLRGFHIDAGLLVLLFAVVRIGWRLVYRAPPVIGTPLQAKLAHALHGVLYLLMFLLPVSGVIFSQAGGHDVALFGWVLPTMVAPDPALRGVVRELHGLMGNAVYFLVGIHVLAALWHHFVLKDDTLRRMRP